MEEDENTNSTNILLGRPFLSTTSTKINVRSGTLSMEFDDVKVTFNMYNAMKYPVDLSYV